MTAGSQIVFVPVHALDPARIASLARIGSFTVCYLGSSYSGCKQLREQLPPGLVDAVFQARRSTMRRNVCAMS